MQRKIRFLALGSLLALAMITALYSPIGSIPFFAIAYAVYRWGSGQELIGDFSTGNNAISHGFEVLSESDDELMVRGNHRVIVLNRRQKTLAGLHGKLADFSQVKHISLGHDREDDAYSVAIVFKGWLSDTTLGYGGQADASSMAALLARWLDKPVIA